MEGAVEQRDDLSVDELARRAGVSVRTIRFYQSEGLLPPPGRLGREARYGRAHVERLDLIAELQARGLRLSAIAELLDRAAGDVPAADWLGLGEALRRPWIDDRPVVLGDRELADRLAGTPADTTEALERSGVLERRPGSGPASWVVPSPALLDIALATGRLGLDPDAGARLLDLLHARLRGVATELVAAFTEEVSRTQLAEQGPDALAALLEQLQPLTRRTVDLLFAHEMERAQQELLDAAALPAIDPTDEGARAP
jgi:DNA-binding transcriptional MerR regulator